MSSSDDAAAKRAAAAEARRQKILARGSERLNRITVGTPIALDAPAISTDEQLPASTAQTLGTPNSNTVESEPSTTIADAPRETIPVESSSLDAAVPHHEAEKHKVLVSGPAAPSRGPQLEQDAESLTAAQWQAEQALHALLNQLAGSGASQLLAGVGAEGGGGPAGPSGRPAPGLAPPSTTPPAVQRVTRDGGHPSTSAPRRAPSRVGTAIAATLTLVAGLLAGLLGPQLSEAVEATRRLRCVVAVALAAVLFWGAVDVGHLGVPPVVALLGTQVALIAAAHTFADSSWRARTRPYKDSSGAPPDGAEDATSGGIGSTESGSGPAAVRTTTGAPLPARSDWLSLVPGLRPLIDRVSSAGALVSGLYGDVAVFLVSYIVLGALREISTGPVVAATGPR